MILIVLITLLLSAEALKLNWANSRLNRISTVLSGNSFDDAAYTRNVPQTSAELIGNKVVNVGKLIFGVASIASILPKPSVADGGKPIVVLGGNGKTAKILIEKLSAGGYSVRPTYRSLPSTSLNLAGLESARTADVTKIDTLEQAIQGASTVVFAASASSKGGNAKAVDFAGVQNVAKECVRLKIPRLIVISSGAVTKPNSLGFKITNLFGGIMDYKLQGENALREIYKNEDKSCSYAIVRPGGLLDGSAVGAKGISLNQGDTISGEVNRADVAECVVAAAVSKSIPPKVTFEVYQTDKSGPLQSEFPKVSGFERTGDSYEQMFAGLKSDI